MGKISIIMPTYNAEKTIEESLKSIREQNYDQALIEILVIDGGSTDRTREIAQKYGATILENEKKLPEPAKEIGLLHANGEYGVYMDSDEILIEKNTFQKRIDVFLADKTIKNVVSAGLICNDMVNPIARYANYTGDPFSYFIYRYNGYNRVENMSRTYKHEKRQGYMLYKFDEDDSLPLFDAGISMFDLVEAKRLYENYDDKRNFASNLFNIMMSESKCVAMIEGDVIYHLPQMTLKGYLAKLKWRVLNNIFSIKEGGVGFSGRAKRDERIRRRQIWYVLYTITFLCPIYDSMRLAIKNRDSIFLGHWLLNLYVFIQICWNMGLKILHIQPKGVKTYG